MGERTTRLSIRGHVLCAAQHQHTHTHTHTHTHCRSVVCTTDREGISDTTTRRVAPSSHHVAPMAPVLRARALCARLCVHRKTSSVSPAIYSRPTYTHTHAHPPTRTQHTTTHNSHTRTHTCQSSSLHRVSSVLDVNLVRSDCHLCVCGEERVQNDPAKHAAVVLLHKHVPANMAKRG
jgi:hypothetical protein